MHSVFDECLSFNTEYEIKCKKTKLDNQGLFDFLQSTGMGTDDLYLCCRTDGWFQHPHYFSKISC